MAHDNEAVEEALRFAAKIQPKEAYIKVLAREVTRLHASAPKVWEPMETAPRDGTVIDLWMVCGCHDHRATDIYLQGDGLFLSGLDLDMTGMVCGNGIELKAVAWMMRPQPPAGGGA